jgi:hypothetical protein
MKLYFNPFGFIFETTTSHYSPHTRTLRTSLLDKLKDTFYVLVGSTKHAPSEERNKRNYRVGLLDFLPFFGLSLISVALVAASDKLHSKFLLYVGNVFHVIFHALKALIAFACLIPSFLFIVGAHLVARIIAGREIVLAESIQFSDMDGAVETLSVLSERVGYTTVFNSQSAVTSTIPDGHSTIEIRIPTDSDAQAWNAHIANYVLPIQLEAYKALNFFDVCDGTKAYKEEIDSGYAP